jgi:hypothetical protein
MRCKTTVYTGRQTSPVAWFAEGALASMKGLRTKRLHTSFEHIGALQAPVRRPIPENRVFDDTRAIASRRRTRVRGQYGGVSGRLLVSPARFPGYHVVWRKSRTILPYSMWKYSWGWVVVWVPTFSNLII